LRWYSYFEKSRESHGEQYVIKEHERNNSRDVWVEGDNVDKIGKKRLLWT